VCAYAGGITNLQDRIPRDFPLNRKVPVQVFRGAGSIGGCGWSCIRGWDAICATPPAAAAGSDEITTQALAPAFRSCSSSRQTTLRTALPNAENYARESLSFLQNLPSSQRPSNARYKTWFGAHTSSRYSTVQSHFSKIAGALTSRTITFHCDCNDSAYAFVFSNDPYNIHLCQAFWTAPARGRDSKAGTIIHEMSHFDVNGGTDDHVYGETGAKNLARTSPSRAVMNADSHEYFAEQ
jgi:peptidyl-Lys metalloendopeptidase